MRRDQAERRDREAAGTARMDAGSFVKAFNSAVAARAIEPLAMLWCIPGFRENSWTHAFKLLR